VRKRQSTEGRESESERELQGKIKDERAREQERAKVKKSTKDIYVYSQSIRRFALGLDLKNYKCSENQLFKKSKPRMKYSDTLGVLKLH